jgi:hypothetical protein
VPSLPTGLDPNWAPDRRVSLPLAAIATLLALCGFVLLLMQPVPPRVRPDTISIRLHAFAEPKQPVQRHERTRVVTAVHGASNPLRIPQPVLQSTERAASGLDLSLPSLPPATPVFLEPKPNRASRDLARTLNAPRKSVPDLQDGDGYRSTAGETIIKSGGECGRVHSIQMSPSPTNKATIGFFTRCPGEYQPTLGEQLLKWSDTKQKPAPPRP